MNVATRSAFTSNWLLFTNAFSMSSMRLSNNIGLCGAGPYFVTPCLRRLKALRYFWRDVFKRVKMFPKLIKKGIFGLLTLPVSECGVSKPDPSRYVPGFAV